MLERAPHRSDGRNRKPRGRSTFSCGAIAIGGIGTLAALRAHAPAVLPPPPEFWAADLLLNCSGAARQQLVDNARWAATLKQRAVELKLAPSTKSWLPLGATPEYGMEQLVALLVNRTLSERRGCGGALDRAAGVEWWLRIHGGREGLGFHHDSNWLDVRAGLNRSLAFPLCSSVFYLTDGGGPLVARPSCPRRRPPPASTRRSIRRCCRASTRRRPRGSLTRSSHTPSLGSTCASTAARTVSFEDVDCAVDFDGDLVVDGADLLQLLTAWGDCTESDCLEDVDGDGLVGGSDLVVLLSAWGAVGESCPDGPTLNEPFHMPTMTDVGTLDVVVLEDWHVDTIDGTTRQKLIDIHVDDWWTCLLYTSPSPRD